MVRLTVADNGSGFQLKEKPKPSNLHSSGLGLVGMRERAHLVGGNFTIKSTPGKGTTISITTPIKELSPAELEPLNKPAFIKLQ